MLKRINIDYKLLDKAQKYYTKKGFLYMESPWMVDNEIAKITANKENSFTANTDTLVGSGEQSFLHLVNNHTIWANNFNMRYQTITPCFRNEKEDDTHSKQFMKLELFSWFNYYIVDDKIPLEIIKELNFITMIAYKFFSKYIPFFSKIDLVFMTEYDSSNDIMYKNIEIGSYGIRKNKELGITWVYGTGLALPRFSYAVTKE